MVEDREGGGGGGGGELPGSSTNQKIIMHGTTLAYGNIQCSNFSIYRKGKITNIGSK